MIPSLEPLCELGNREEKMHQVKCWSRGRAEVQLTELYISSMRLAHGAVTLAAVRGAFSHLKSHGSSGIPHFSH